MTRFTFNALSALLGAAIVFGAGMTTGRVLAAQAKATAAPATPNAVQLAGNINGQPIPVTLVNHDASGRTRTGQAKITGGGMIFTNAGAITVEFQSDQLYCGAFGP